MARTASFTPIPNAKHDRHGGAFGMVTSGVILLWAELRHRQRQRITRKILEALDDRTLHDIGIDRSEITSVVRTRAVDHRINYDHLF